MLKAKQERRQVQSQALVILRVRIRCRSLGDGQQLDIEEYRRLIDPVLDLLRNLVEQISL
jgi:hypothetical protein